MAALWLRARAAYGQRVSLQSLAAYEQGPGLRVFQHRNTAEDFDTKRSVERYELTLWRRINILFN